MNNNKLQIRKVKAKNVISIINVYAPHTNRVKVDPEELHQFYTELGETIENIRDSKTCKTSLLLIAGDFNAKVGQSIANEPCLGSFSRGLRNHSGQTLIDFCNIHEMFITNSSFQHPARHITTWESTRTLRNNTVLHIFNQIDYIICQQTQKNILTNSRSYAGTMTDSDHRLVITEMNIKPYYLFKPQKQNQQKFIDCSKLSDSKISDQYRENLSQNLKTIDSANCTRGAVHAHTVRGTVPDDATRREEPGCHTRREDPGVAAVPGEVANDHVPGELISKVAPGEAQNCWDKIVKTIIETAESTLGFKSSTKNNRTYDPEIEILSKQQKILRNQISTCNEIEEVKQMKSQRNKILHAIKAKTLQNRNAEIDSKVHEINNLQDNTKMYKAVKSLKRKKFENPFVCDNDGKRITNPTAIYEHIRDHFYKHFHKNDIPSIQPFVGEPEPLQKPICIDEVIKAIKKLNNNRAADIDGMTAEFLKHAPRELHEWIVDILNDVLENHSELDLGTGILVALQKPGKEKGPVKNLRPVILLLILRKVLSNITFERIKPQYENYISPSQSAYRSNRSTSDIVWAHRWIAAKAQKVQTKIFITGLDMSAAFDTIKRNELLDILSSILGPDEMKMMRLLLSNTTLDIKMRGVKTEKFESNIGSPQGDGISGVVFNIYLEDSLQELRVTVDANDIRMEHNYAITQNTMLPDEAIYADDTDFIHEDESRKNIVVAVAADTLLISNLLVNDDKTEHTVIERGDRNTELWRSTKKLGSLLGDVEDIANRKQLAIAGMNEMNKIWIRKDRISESRRLGLYGTLVKSILTYNCGTWGMTKKDEDNIDSFHRNQLRRVIGKRWPHRISNYNLYKRCHERPISLFITASRWKLFGHILRADPRSPAFRAMLFYFEPSNNKSFRGRPRCTIATTLDNDIKKTAAKINTFPFKHLKNVDDLLTICTVAQDRKRWKNVVKDIISVAKAEKPIVFL